MRDRSRVPWLGAVLLACWLGAAPPAAAQNCAGNATWVSNPSQPNFNQDPPSFCGFFQYAWQSFLYLTSPAPGGGVLNFETYPLVTDVVPPTSPPPNPCYDADERQRDKRRFFDVRDAKLDEFQQAGPGGVLINQKGMVTYYEQYLDPTAASFIQGCHLNIKSCASAPAAQTLRFPAAAIELKVSWMPMAASDPNLAKYYTVPQVTAWNPQANGGQGTCQTYDYVGLIGFHLVYTTPGHEEMVWASFEHEANAPDGPCTGPTTPPAGYGGWAFNDATSKDCSQVNAWKKGTPPPYPVTQAFRNWAFGGGTPATVAIVQSINGSMAGLLPADSVWQNYFLLGAVWTDGDLPAVPPGQPGANEVASTFLANVTMETFTQFPNPAPTPPPSFPINCFSCHNTSTDEPQPFQVSHTLNDAAAGTCPYSDQLPAACQATQPGTSQARRGTPVAPVASH